MEVLKFRLDVMQLLREFEETEPLKRGAKRKAPWFASDDPAMFGAKLTLTPDISFATLGVLGLKHRSLAGSTRKKSGDGKSKEDVEHVDFGFSTSPEFGGPTLQKRYEEWLEGKAPVFRSAFVDVEVSLVECLNFIAMTRRTLGKTEREQTA